MAKAAGKPRKKLPKELAVIRVDNCTGCDACIEVCPVNCIYKVPGEDQPGLQTFCDIDLERCIGCELCERWCPWDAIDMVPTAMVAEHVADKGGPQDYVAKNGERLVAVACSLAELCRTTMEMIDEYWPTAQKERTGYI
jgi:Na+-translocating ferredoxin:NAD+ oxidoreductase subunit B